MITSNLTSGVHPNIRRRHEEQKIFLRKNIVININLNVQKIGFCSKYIYLFKIKIYILSKTNQILIGFALESDNEIENAKTKLKNKNLDAIILNSINDRGAGFIHDTNKITYINKDSVIKKFKLKDKKEVANDIFDLIIKQINE